MTGQRALFDTILPWSALVSSVVFITSIILH